MTGVPLTAPGGKSRVILLQIAGNLVLWSVIIVAIVAVGFLAVLLYLHALAWVFEHIIPWMLNAASTVSGVCVFVFLPLCIFKRTRPWAGLGFFLSSWAFALTLVVFSCVVAFGNWGYVGLLGGLLLGGLGAIPIAFVAALTHGEWDAAGLI